MPPVNPVNAGSDALTQARLANVQQQQQAWQNSLSAMSHKARPTRHVWDKQQGYASQGNIPLGSTFGAAGAAQRYLSSSGPFQLPFSSLNMPFGVRQPPGVDSRSFPAPAAPNPAWSGGHHPSWSNGQHPAWPGGDPNAENQDQQDPPQDGQQGRGLTPVMQALAASLAGSPEKLNLLYELLASGESEARILEIFDITPALQARAAILADRPESLSLLFDLSASGESEARILEILNPNEIDPLQQAPRRQPPLPAPPSVGGDEPDPYPAPVFSQMEQLQRAYAEMGARLDPQQQQNLDFQANSFRQQEAFQFLMTAMVQQHQMFMAGAQAILEAAKGIR